MIKKAIQTILNLFKPSKKPETKVIEDKTVQDKYGEYWTDSVPNKGDESQ